MALERRAHGDSVTGTADAPRIDPFDRLQASLREVLRVVRDVDGPESSRTIGCVETCSDTLSRIVGIWRIQRAPSDALSTWLHELRDPVSVMAGCAHMLRTLDSEAKRARAQQAIERNARLLEQVLAATLTSMGPCAERRDDCAGTANISRADRG